MRAERVDDDRSAARLGRAAPPRELDIRTLVVRGRYDLCTERIASVLVDNIRGSRYVVLEESSHTPVLEETDRHLEIVGDFLAAADFAQTS